MFTTLRLAFQIVWAVSGLTRTISFFDGKPNLRLDGGSLGPANILQKFVDRALNPLTFLQTSG
jgi:hypothetical protein